jgi:PAS domain S-box-containing protein
MTDLGSYCGFAIFKQNAVSFFTPEIEGLINQMNPQDIGNWNSGNLPNTVTINEDTTVTIYAHDQDTFLYLFHNSTAYDQLFASHRDLESIFQSSHDGIYVTDGQGNTLRSNPATERNFAVSPGELIGKNVLDLENEGIFRPSVVRKVLEVRAEQTIMQETRGDKVILTTGNPVFDEEGEITKVICNSRDVTELFKLRVQLKENEAKMQRYESELMQLRKKETSIEGFVTNSEVMNRIVSMLNRISVFDSNVLITGESGTGKEVIAKAIHSLSLRESGPFIKVNCGAIPENLLESELFGYDSGAFTGAKKEGKLGYFELADKGTLLLDEIGELPVSLQAKLLQAIQDKAVQRVGGTKNIPVDFRLVAATNRNLSEMVKAGQFREDLYYRLNVIPIEVPPLRERNDDIPFLIQLFLDKFSQQYHLLKKMETKAIHLFCEYDWPGNVRQLQNVIERLVVLTDGEVITERNVQDQFKSIYKIKPENKIFDEAFVESQAIENNDTGRSLQEILKEVEKHHIIKALKEHKSTRKAAGYLNMSQSTLVRRAKELGIALS